MKLTHIANKTYAFQSESDLVAKRFVGFGTDEAVKAVSAAGEVVKGVCREAALTGEVAEIDLACGGSLVEASEAIAAGAEIASTADGKAKIAASGEFIVGRAFSAATADGDLMSIVLSPEGIKA